MRREKCLSLLVCLALCVTGCQSTEERGEKAGEQIGVEMDRLALEHSETGSRENGMVTMQLLSIMANRMNAVESESAKVREAEKFLKELNGLSGGESLDAYLDENRSVEQKLLRKAYEAQIKDTERMIEEMNKPLPTE